MVMGEENGRPFLIDVQTVSQHFGRAQQPNGPRRGLAPQPAFCNLVYDLNMYDGNSSSAPASTRSSASALAGMHPFHLLSIFVGLIVRIALGETMNLFPFGF
jgi:hypothetical protein